MRRIGAATSARVGALACALTFLAAPAVAPARAKTSSVTRAPIVAVNSAVVRLGDSASITVRGVESPRLEVRLAGATKDGGYLLGWKPLVLDGGMFRGSLPRPEFQGIYPIELRAAAGRQVMRSPRWLLRVFGPGVISRPSFATPEGVARWWVRTLPGGPQLVALRRWRPLAFDLREPRLHQLLVVAYAPAGRPDESDRLGMFLSTVRDGFNGRWRLLEATVQP